MDFFVRNSKFEILAVLDQFVSAIWTRRYYSCGDFEMKLPATTQLVALLQPGVFITRADDTTVMCIEKMIIETDTENGNFLTISGRSAEALLERRVLLAPFIVQSTTVEIQSAFTNLLQLCFDASKNAARPHRVADEIHFGVAVESEKAKVSLLGALGIDYYKRDSNSGSLYDILTSVLEIAELGLRFKIQAVGNRQKLCPKLYAGEDRTESVIFSPAYSNLVNSSYEKDISNVRTHCLCYGETDGLITQRLYCYRAGVSASTQPTGLDCRETVIKGDDQGDYGATQWAGMLYLQGCAEVAELSSISTAFSGEITTDIQYQYRKDWDLGDIVHVENEFGIAGTARVLAVSEKWDVSGTSIVPTLSDWKTMKNVGEEIVDEAEGTA